MLITDIKFSKNSKILIYSGDRYLTSLSPEVFARYNLKINSEISESELESIILNSQEYKAKERALNILSYRAHSKNELKNKIKAKFGEQCAQNTVNKIEELGLIDDKAFAENYALELMNKKYYSKRRVKFELMKKNISSEIINNILNNIEIDEYEILRNIIEKKNFDNITDEKSKRRAINYLLRLGYDFEQINNILKI